eukprot:scaffold45028_cov51-Attheya_sp.AAC.3
MGCTSSTQTTLDPATGQEKKKKKSGGAYPGRRGTAQPYVPPDHEFDAATGATSNVTAHFVSVGGGNALVLMNKPNKGASQKQFISVTLPDGVSEGDSIHVQAPDGQLNEIIVPPGMGPGSTFTVEFAPTPSEPTATAVAMNPDTSVDAPIATSYPSPPSYDNAPYNPYNGKK